MRYLVVSWRTRTFRRKGYAAPHVVRGKFASFVGARLCALLLAEDHPDLVVGLCEQQQHRTYRVNEAWGTDG